MLVVGVMIENRQKYIFGVKLENDILAKIDFWLMLSDARSLGAHLRGEQVPRSK